MCSSDGELSVVRSLADALADEIKEAVGRLEEMAGAFSGEAVGAELAKVTDDLTSIAVRTRMLGM